MKEQILELRKTGASYRIICEQLGCSKGTVAFHCGQGQKEKTKKRKQKSRENKVLLGRINKFKNKSLRDRSDGFQRRDGRITGLDRSKIVFSYKDVIDKLGSEPTCYLTGQSIDLSEKNSYEFDHIVPASRGGTNGLDNLGLACKQANHCKSNMTVDELLAVCQRILEHFGYTVKRKGKPIGDGTPLEPGRGESP